MKRRDLVREKGDTLERKVSAQDVLRETGELLDGVFMPGGAFRYLRREYRAMPQSERPTTLMRGVHYAACVYAEVMKIPPYVAMYSLLIG